MKRSKDEEEVRQELNKENVINVVKYQISTRAKDTQTRIGRNPRGGETHG